MLLRTQQVLLCPVGEQHPPKLPPQGQAPVSLYTETSNFHLQTTIKDITFACLGK